jgi:hypothetical protein
VKIVNIGAGKLYPMSLGICRDDLVDRVRNLVDFEQPIGKIRRLISLVEEQERPPPETKPPTRRHIDVARTVWVQQNVLERSGLALWLGQLITPLLLSKPRSNFNGELRRSRQF